MSESNLIILPNGLPTRKVRETLTREEIDLVQKMEAWCAKRGLVLDLLCQHCLDAGHGRASRIRGDNVRNSTTFHMDCAHADRVYGEGATRE